MAIHTNYVPVVHLSMVRERYVSYGEEGKVDTPQKVVNMVERMLKDLDREHLLAISVDSQNTPTAIECVAIGSLNSVYALPREIFKSALLANAAGIILVHNHPSEDVAPSQDDFKFTKRVKQAGKIIGVELLDHIIIGGNNNFLALSETGEWEEM